MATKNYRRRLTNPEREYHDRTEILKTDFRLQDRIDGIVGMTVDDIHVKSDLFIMVCSDKENGRGMRVQVAKSGYGQYGTYLRLSATEIIYKTKEEKEEWTRKEGARRERLSTKWFEKHGEPHPQYGLPKDTKGKIHSESPDAVQEKIEQIRQKHKTSKKTNIH